jgi:hypothetical protein
MKLQIMPKRHLINSKNFIESQLGDPKVAEKLRIYRLVEDQFTHIEAEVEREVLAEIESKKKLKNDLASVYSTR